MIRSSFRLSVHIRTRKLGPRDLERHSPTHKCDNPQAKEKVQNQHPEIPPVTHSEVTEAIRKAPTHSTIGRDDIGLPLIKGYHTRKPATFARIFTNILRSGKHPESWKKAVVVPIPKANKPSYNTAKAWRSIHLLSLMSKTLERIVLSRLQDHGESIGETLGPTQFGSRRNTGTSDAMKTIIKWKGKAEEENQMVTFVIADVEGGFDKVNPLSFRDKETEIDNRYSEWIYNWSTNRVISFRFNDKTDGREYVTNSGIPQGSPLSPYLFGAYVKKIMYSSGRTEEQDDFLLISYVDDLIICIKGRTEEEMERKTRAAWAEVNRRATSRGMSFAENKTKTWHGGRSGSYPNWGIGKTSLEIRILGYWIRDHRSESFEKHVKHWLTKANYAYNKLRALTQRSEKGLKTIPTLRILHSVVRTMAWYGLEFYGDNPLRTKEVDSFLYETISRLLDMPLATPHRAISAEFAMTPTAIQAKYVKSRIQHRHERFPHILDATHLFDETYNITNDHVPVEDDEPILPWQVAIPEPGGPVIRKLPDKYPTDLVGLKKLTSDNDLVVYTDGSHTTERTSYAAVIINTHTGSELNHINGTLSKGKTIADAETYAIYQGLLLAMDTPNKIKVTDRDKGKLRIIVVLTDSTTAFEAVVLSLSHIAKREEAGSGEDRLG